MLRDRRFRRFAAPTADERTVNVDRLIVPSNWASAGSRPKNKAWSWGRRGFNPRYGHDIVTADVIASATWSDVPTGIPLCKSALMMSVTCRVTPPVSPQMRSAANSAVSTKGTEDASSSFSSLLPVVSRLHS